MRIGEDEESPEYTFEEVPTSDPAQPVPVEPAHEPAPAETAKEPVGV